LILGWLQRDQPNPANVCWSADSAGVLNGASRADGRAGAGVGVDVSDLAALLSVYGPDFR
jgi:hypothetical protein